MIAATYIDPPACYAATEIAASAMSEARHTLAPAAPISRSFIGTASWGYALGIDVKAARQTSISSDAPIFLSAVRNSDVLVADLLALQSLAAGWDGECAAEPNAAAIQDARRFVRAAGEIAEILEPTLHVDGSVILEVGDGAEGSLRFRGDGKVIFATEFDRGVLEFSDFDIPERIRTALSNYEKAA